MNSKDLRIVFMGTPEFAVASLQALHESGYNIVAVVTMPDKPAGRGHKIRFSPVKQYALQNKLPLLQPERLKEESFLTELKALKADLQIVVAFRMLPEAVWAMPPLGTFNLHSSLLPQYRGAAPINWAVINGETQTGVTTFFLQHEIDTGNIILQAKTPVSPQDNAGTVHDRLMEIGAELVQHTVGLIATGAVEEKPQPHSNSLKSAPKIFKETCLIDWKKTAVEIHNLVRGLSPYPAAWTELVSPAGEVLSLKIFETEIENTPPQEPVGTLLTDNRSYVKVAVSGGYILLKSVQMAGKKRMAVADLLNGYKLDGYKINPKD